MRILSVIFAVLSCDGNEHKNKQKDKYKADRNKRETEHIRFMYVIIIGITWIFKSKINNYMVIYKLCEKRKNKNSSFCI